MPSLSSRRQSRLTCAQKNGLILSRSSRCKYLIGQRLDRLNVHRRRAAVDCGRVGARPLLASAVVYGLRSITASRSDASAACAPGQSRQAYSTSLARAIRWSVWRNSTCSVTPFASMPENTSVLTLRWVTSRAAVPVPEQLCHGRNKASGPRRWKFLSGRGPSFFLHHQLTRLARDPNIYP